MTEKEKADRIQRRKMQLEQERWKREQMAKERVARGMVDDLEKEQLERERMAKERVARGMADDLEEKQPAREQVAKERVARGMADDLEEKQPAREQVAKENAAREMANGSEQRKQIKKKENNSEQQKKKKTLTEQEKLEWYGSVGDWFQWICFMKIPVFGFFYMLIKALRKSTPIEKKSLATAYVLYRILVLILAVVIIIVFYKIGLNFIDGILKYAGN